MARAAVYAVERAQAIAAGDNPKYTPYPTTWLRKKKYNEPYPPGVIIDEAGNVVAIEDDDGDGDNSFDVAFRRISTAGRLQGGRIMVTKSVAVIGPGKMLARRRTVES